MIKDKVLIVTLSKFDEKSIQFDGVSKKMINIIESFEKLNYNVVYTGIINNKICIFEGNNKNFVGETTGFPYKDRVTLYKYLKKNVRKYVLPKYVYIRHIGSDFSLLSMVKKYSQEGSKVILEFPTYPYYKEKFRSIKSLLGLLLDLLCNKFIVRNLAISLNSSGYDTIFGCKSYSMENGINIKNYTKHQKKLNAKRIINLIAVSSMAKWHGYERVIEGLKEYKDNMYHINLHLVGDGPELKHYKDLALKYHLNDNIKFYGNVGGKELDSIFEESDIALSSFGLYKIGLDKVSTLKVKEYCARGIPFVFANEEMTLTKEKSYFAYRVPNDCSPIEMSEIIDFYEEIINIHNIADEMRKFAVKYYSYESELRNVIKLIE